MKSELQRDPVRVLLGFLILGGLAAISVWIMKPFLPAVIWATMIVVATWPLMRMVEARLWKKRGLATAVMTLLMLLTFVIPLTLAIMTIVNNMDVITGFVKNAQSQAFDVPPEWVAKIPFVGGWLDETWRETAASGDFGGKIGSLAAALGAWFVAQIGHGGTVFLQFLLTIAISAIFYQKGEIVAAGAMRFARKIDPERGEASLILASKAIRGVALGVVVTAFAQAVMGGIGLAIAGVPYAAVLTAVMFMLALAQIGAVPIMVCAAVWAFWRGDTGWGVFLSVWTLIVGGMDNILRPILIKKGVDLPLLLILVGVIGGLVALGLVGIFIGPAVLAVTYQLLKGWTASPSPHELPTDPAKIH